MLSREKFRRYITIAQVREYLLWLRDHATVVEVAEEDVFAGATPDPDDDYLIAVATRSETGILVSGDSHLLGPGTDITGGSVTTIITPRDFLGHL